MKEYGAATNLHTFSTRRNDAESGKPLYPFEIAGAAKRPRYSYDAGMRTVAEKITRLVLRPYTLALLTFVILAACGAQVANTPAEPVAEPPKAVEPARQVPDDSTKSADAVKSEPAVPDKTGQPAEPVDWLHSSHPIRGYSSKLLSPQTPAFMEDSRPDSVAVTLE